MQGWPGVRLVEEQGSRFLIVEGDVRFTDLDLWPAKQVNGQTGRTTRHRTISLERDRHTLRFTNQSAHHRPHKLDLVLIYRVALIRIQPSGDFRAHAA